MSSTPTSAALKKLASTLVSPLPPPGSVRQRRQTSTFSIASTSNAGTPAKRGRGRPPKKQKEESEDSEELTDPDESSDEDDEDEEEGAGGTGTPRSGGGNRRTIDGEDLWTEEMDEVLIRGMKKIPKMGRRSIVLESDGETYGRVGLLGEYLRRQTGIIRNRTQCASHMMIQKKRATKQKDDKMLELIDGTPLSPSQDLYKLDFDTILGSDRHPETLEAAAEENRSVKANRTALNDARKTGGGGGSVAGSAKKRGRSAGGSARKKRKIETEDDEDSEESSEEESSSEEEMEEPVPVKKKRGRPRKHPLPVDKPTKSTPSSTKKPKRQSNAIPKRKYAPRRSTVPSKQKQEDGAEMSSDLSSAEESEQEQVVERKKPLKPATLKKPKSSSPAKMDVDDDESGSREGAGTVAIRAQEPPQTGSWLFGGLKKIISWF